MEILSTLRGVFSTGPFLQQERKTMNRLCFPHPCLPFISLHKPLLIMSKVLRHVFLYPNWPSLPCLFYGPLNPTPQRGLNNKARLATSTPIQNSLIEIPIPSPQQNVPSTDKCPQTAIFFEESTYMYPERGRKTIPMINSPSRESRFATF